MNAWVKAGSVLHYKPASAFQTDHRPHPLELLTSIPKASYAARKDDLFQSAHQPLPCIASEWERELQDAAKPAGAGANSAGQGFQSC